jgi:uncharacterized protein (TIGR02611 family)
LRVQSVRSVVRFVLRSSKRAAISVVGFTLVGVGLVMLVTPGPGLLVVIAGLAVLATEFAWAQRSLEKARHRAARAKDAIVNRRSRSTRA